mmetsp:Transcript_10948/g.20106  ORF Transcript_10948/g.20106 Transcript_10948/m.20106 type:complete len:132 (+) Transcript_10948:45-440(+)
MEAKTGDLRATGKINISNPTKQGWLQKQSRFWKTWRSRWFVLQDSVLYSFKHEKLYENPTEVIDLKVFTSVKSSKEYTNKTNSFDIYSKEMAFSLLAKSAEEKEDWIRAIGKAIVMSRNNLTFDRQDSDSD